MLQAAACVGFETLSVRVTLLDSDPGRLGTASAVCSLHCKRNDPGFAIQFHTDGSSVAPVDAEVQLLEEHYPWRDHHALHEAQEIAVLAHAWLEPFANVHRRLRQIAAQVHAKPAAAGALLIP